MMGGLNLTTTFVPERLAEPGARLPGPPVATTQTWLLADVVQDNPVFITVSAGGIHAVSRKASRLQHARRREVRRRERRRGFNRRDMAIRAETAVNSRIIHIEQPQRLGLKTRRSEDDHDE